MGAPDWVPQAKGSLASGAADRHSCYGIAFDYNARRSWILRFFESVLKLFAVFTWASKGEFSVSGGSKSSHKHRDTVPEYSRLRGVYE